MDNIKYIEDKKFVGYNDTESPENLPVGILADALNCFMRTGEIVKRNGYTIVANDVGANACQGLKGVEFADSTKRIYTVFNGGVYSWGGSGDWTSLGGTLHATDPVDIVVANNNVYFFDGTNTVIKVNSSNTLSTVAAIPLGKYARWFHNQLHVAGISGSPNKLRSSDIGDPETFTGGNSSNLDINPNDGDIITGLIEFKDELIVPKRNRIWSMTGFGTSALTLANLNERLTGFGSLSHRGLINIGNDVLYIGFLGTKPVIRSLQQTRYSTNLVDAGSMSDDIETTMNGLNKGQLTKTAGIFDGRYAWFALPNGASTTNNLVLTLDTSTINYKYKGWSRHTGINASVFDSFAITNTPELYFGEATADSKVYKFDTSKSDNGATINFSITSRRYAADNIDLKKKFKWLYLWAKEVGNYDVTIDKSLDGFSYDNLGTINLSGTGSTLDTMILDTSRLGSTDVKKDRFTFGKSRNYYLQLKMYDTSATSEVNLRNWSVYYQLKRRPIDV